MRVIPEMNYRASAEQREAAGRPCGGAASAVILLSHLEATGNQDRRKRQDRHAHKYPSQIDNRGQMRVDIGFYCFTMNDADPRSMQQSAPEAKHAAYQHQNALHGIPFAAIVFKVFRPGELYNVRRFFFWQFSPNFNQRVFVESTSHVRLLRSFFS